MTTNNTTTEATTRNMIAQYIIQQVKIGDLTGTDFDVTIRTPKDGFRIMKAYLGDPDREHAVLLCLNTKNRVTAIHTLSIGSLSAAIVHPREVFKLAILHNSAGILLCHNHPSNDCTPSKEDIEITTRIQEAGEVLGIELLDHLVIGETSFVSLKESGFMV